MRFLASKEWRAIAAVLLFSCPRILGQVQTHNEQSDVPLLFKLIEKTIFGVYSVAHFCNRHPKTSSSLLAATALTLYARKELHRSGLVLKHQPHFSLAPPSDTFMCELLLISAENDLNNPKPGISQLNVENDQETANDDSEDDSGNWNNISESIVIGKGVALYRKASRDLMHFSQFDNLDRAELVISSEKETDQDDCKVHTGINVGILQKIGLLWSFVPLRVIYCDTPQIPSSENSSRTSYILSSINGSGFIGEWRFCTSFNADTDDVSFEASLHRTGKSSIIGKSQAKLLQSMLLNAKEKANNDQQLVMARLKQKEKFEKLSSIANAKRLEKKRERILHPEKYERKHVRIEEDGNTKNPGRARWGKARRADDYHRRTGH